MTIAPHVDGRIRTRGLSWAAWARTLRSRRRIATRSRPGPYSATILGARRPTGGATAGTGTVHFAIRPTIHMHFRHTYSVRGDGRPSSILAVPSGTSRRSAAPRRTTLSHPTIRAVQPIVVARPRPTGATRASSASPSMRPASAGTATPAIAPLATSAPSRVRVASDAGRVRPRSAATPRTPAADLAHRPGTSSFAERRVTPERDRTREGRSDLSRSPTGRRRAEVMRPVAMVLPLRAGPGAAKNATTSTTGAIPPLIPPTPPAPRLPSIEDLTEQIVREIDRRILAERERMGRGAF